MPTGYMYPNEIHPNWGILIVLYLFITGVDVGAFVLASLSRVFGVRAVKPARRLAMLAALSFLVVAPLPLLFHLGQPQRCFEMYLTPHVTSAMAMFGYIYLWYLMAIVLVEVWLDFRQDIVLLSQSTSGLRRLFYRVLTLGSDNVSEGALRLDDRVGRVVTTIGIPSAILMIGYVGFIFGSIKANPWWSTPMMPVVFLFSAIVSGIAAVLLLYMLTSWLRRLPIDMHCLDTMGRSLFYSCIIVYGLLMVDTSTRIYEAVQSFRSLDTMVHTELFVPEIVIQIILGALVPMALLALAHVVRLPEMVRKAIYAIAGCLALIGVFFMRWNLVIGGNLISKTFLGYTPFNISVGGREGLFAAILAILPLIIFIVLVKLFPPWSEENGLNHIHGGTGNAQV